MIKNVIILIIEQGYRHILTFNTQKDKSTIKKLLTDLDLSDELKNRTFQILITDAYQNEHGKEERNSTKLEIQLSDPQNELKNKDGTKDAEEINREIKNISKLFEKVN